MGVKANPLPDEDDTKNVHINDLSEDDSSGSSESESENEAGVCKESSKEAGDVTRGVPSSFVPIEDDRMSAMSADQLASTHSTTHGNAKTFKSHRAETRSAEETCNQNQGLSSAKDNTPSDRNSGVDKDTLRQWIKSTVKNVLQSKKPKQWKSIDGVIVFNQRDYEHVLQFKRFIEDVMRTEHEHIRIELFESQKFIQSKVRNVEDIISKCCVIFVFLTDNTNTPDINFFCEEAIGRLRLDPCNQSEIASAFALDTPSRCLLQPVHTKPKHLRTYSTPPGLFSINAVDWFDITSSFTRDKIIQLMKSAKKLRKRHETEVNTNREFQHIYREQQTSTIPASSHTRNFNGTTEHVQTVPFTSVPAPPTRQFPPYQGNHHVQLDTQDTFKTKQDEEMIRQSRMLLHENDDHLYRHNIPLNHNNGNVSHSPFSVNQTSTGGHQHGHYYEAMPSNTFHMVPNLTRTTPNNNVNSYDYARRDTQYVLHEQNLTPAANGRVNQQAFAEPTLNTMQSATNGQHLGAYGNRAYPTDYSHHHGYHRNGANFYHNLPPHHHQPHYSLTSHECETSIPHASRQHQPQNSVSRHDGDTNEIHSSRQHQPQYSVTSHDGVTSNPQSSRQHSFLHEDTHNTPLNSELTVVSKVTGKLIINPELSTDDVEIDTEHSSRSNHTAAIDTLHKYNSEDKFAATKDDEYLTEDQTSESSTCESDSGDVGESDSDDEGESDSDDEGFAKFFVNHPHGGKTVNIVGSSIVQIGSNNSVSSTTIGERKSGLKGKYQENSSMKTNGNRKTNWDEKFNIIDGEVSNRPTTPNKENDVSNSHIDRGKESENDVSNSYKYRRKDSENNYLDDENTTNARSRFTSNIHVDDFISDSELFSDGSSISERTFSFNQIKNTKMKSDCLIQGFLRGPFSKIKLSLCQSNSNSEVD
ncbi:uncharacterized protein LOC128217501 [Mya arenaria]|uniref:uncharacterized protein LOC128217501 n=1 Tax=Mya arenaria TaxID=6604 RepID=UPI0022E8B2B9|nr:uncharacterized protein LOC128217501 [Mya arenaria]